MVAVKMRVIGRMRRMSHNVKLAWLGSVANAIRCPRDTVTHLAVSGATQGHTHRDFGGSPAFRADCRLDSYYGKACG